MANVQARLYLDDTTTPFYTDVDGKFSITNISDGNHSLHIYVDGEVEIVFPFRMTERRGLDFGLMHISSGQVQNYTGFNGYHFGWIDEEDGIPDMGVDIRVSRA